MRRATRRRELGHVRGHVGVGTSRVSGVGAGVRVDLFAFACHSALTMAIPTKAARGDG